MSPADGTAGDGARGLEARALRAGYGRRAVLHDLTLAFPEGRVTAIVGGNASGKSTLLRTLARLLRPQGGAVVLDGEELHGMPTREVARKIGLLPQSAATPEGLRVEELVARGRHPHRRMLRSWTEHDAAIVEWALAATATAALRERPVDELSGGQRQRAWIAMALAQDPGTLLLDEPTTFLDLAHQLDVLELLVALNRRERRTIVLVLHDLNQAARYADHLVAMRDGTVHASGPPAEIVDATLVREVFGVEVRVIADPTCGSPLCLPLPRDADGLPPRPGAGDAALLAPAELGATPHGPAR
jgi:iron complex transport system ATP-binding protein